MESYDTVDNAGSTPKECCNKCIANPDCLAWISDNQSRCSHATITDASKCTTNSIVSQPIAGLIRCPGGPNCSV